jgi:two-component system chemotaxis response regulator CheB
MRKIRVLVVDDSTVVRRLVADALADDPAIEVVGTAANGKIALAKLPQLHPDAMTLDIEMPDMDGLATLAELRKIAPRLPVIMFSTLTQKGAVATINALALGASDYVTKPSNVGSVAAGMAAVREQLVPKLKSLCPFADQVQPVCHMSVRREAGRTAPASLVVIGVSTGGPNALTELFKRVPGNFPVPIVIVQHMPPVFTRFLAERLDAVSPLTVREARGGELLQPGTVWLAPGDYHLALAAGDAGLLTRLHQGPHENSCRPAVDVLFRSAAEVVGRGTLAVVLTGMGRDGQRGAEAICDAGGRVIAALPTNWSEVLGRSRSSNLSLSPRVDTMSTATVPVAGAFLDPASFDYIRSLVLQRSAIALEENKGYLVESRLSPLARKQGWSTLAELVAALRSAPYGVLHDQVVDAMTTNETSFFRDAHPFETMRSTFLPELIAARSAQRMLNIWSAACSSGQEPYTIAMVVREYFPQLAGWQMRIVATDLSQEMLERAESGRYSQAEVNRGLPAPLLVKYFQRDGLHWVVKPEVRQAVRFCRLNLTESWHQLPTFDLVFMRNVLIYFKPDVKRLILGKLRRQLAADGILLLGGAETTIGIDDNFYRHTVGKTTLYRLSAPKGGTGMA